MMRIVGLAMLFLAVMVFFALVAYMGFSGWSL